LSGLPECLRDDCGSAPVIFLKLIVTNLRRHRIRSFISVAGIAFSVAAMLTVVTILQGAIGMFSGILSSDSEIIVFERNVSDLFFSNVPAAAGAEIAGWPMVSHADPVLFGIVSSADPPDHHLLWRDRCRRAHPQGRMDRRRSPQLRATLRRRGSRRAGSGVSRRQARRPCAHRARRLPRDRNSEDGQRLRGRRRLHAAQLPRRASFTRKAHPRSSPSSCATRTMRPHSRAWSRRSSPT
jgi:hypothetical protein